MLPETIEENSEMVYLSKFANLISSKGNEGNEGDILLFQGFASILNALGECMIFKIY